MRQKPVVFVFRVAVALGVVLAFWMPAARLLSSVGAAPIPAPLDDVYIYFDFARSTGRGCFLCYGDDTGFSTGATSPPYALVLALGWLAGFREGALGIFAALVAAVALVDLFRSAAELVPAPPILRWLAPVVLVGVPVLSWSFASGMETAFVAAVAGRALVASARTWRAVPHTRPRAQRRAGFWIALLAWSRPECIPMAFALAVAVGHGAGSTPLGRTLARALGPLVVGGAAWALFVRASTGEWAAAGAIRKLATSDPYATPIDVAGVWLKNLLRLGTEGVEMALGGSMAALVTAVLAAASLSRRETRRIGAVLLGGAVSALALVCINTTAPFQNLRYATPTLLMTLLAALVGVRAIHLRSRSFGALGALGLGLSVAASARAFPKQIDHFARASKNIAEQQVVVGARLRELGAERVLVGDAGAIPYVGGMVALDGLGLGGYHDLPFARASVHGMPAVIELIERLPEAERPDYLAIYDGWWPGLGERFGHRVLSVKIDDNVICGADEKVVYRADWRLLRERPAVVDPVLDRIDVADLVDERAHRLTFTRPRGGYVVDAVLPDQDGAERWDAGRLLADGQSLSFDVLPRAPAERPTLLVTTDGPAEIHVEQGAERASLEVGPADGGWTVLRARLSSVQTGDRLRLVASGSVRIFAVTLLR